ncbi:MAG: radical SAM protein [Nitrospiraceae bacterium]|nr:MAG: radical SAM protein [Nitrospiraceae bacterium]
MNKNILLIYPKYSYPRKNPPLGLAYLASFVRREGFNPLIIDLNIENYSDEKIQGLVREFNPVVTGISFMTNQYGECVRLAELIKSASKSACIVAGGPHVSALPKEILLECPAIDFTVIGEGELTFLELVTSISSGEKKFDHINGICFRAGAEIIRTGARDLMEDVESLPFPAWDLIRVEKYSVFSIGEGNTFALLSSRGCPNHCIFCDSHTVFGRKFRARSAQHIFSEIKFLHRQYGMTIFDFVDDMITLNKGRVLELCRLIKESGIAFKWMANARVNTIDREMLIRMKESGCIRIDVGVESGDPAVRKIAKKGTTNEQIINAHKWARETGIQIGAFTMVGNLGETMESVRMTAELLKNIGEDVMISIACPFPGTDLYRTAREKGYLRVIDWSRYVTSPTYLKDYKPIMDTDTMTEKEILNAYYYLHSFFARRKFRARYGKYFLLNPVFMKEWLFKSTDQGGLLRKASMAFNLVRARLAI